MHLPAILGSWGHPPDRPAWGALIAAGVAFGVAVGVGRFGRRGSPRARGRSQPLSARTTVALLACAAMLLSLGYIAFYLRGGARIVDATSYFLQARALSEGHFAWRVPEPTASFRGRFLLFHDGEIAGIFPPGYPLLLSLGFAIGAPYVIGPLLAGAIVVATSWLGRDLARDAGMDARAARVVALTAACLSVACGALRYHTADTMAHGACALAFTLALLAALRARRDRLPWFFLLAGIPLGFVVATRFASALALGAVVFWLALRARARTKALLACALGAIPGVLLLLIAQSASTGRALGSTQAAYYATSDGPPGCFRYGFGAGIGCLVEHGDFVRARASHAGTEAAEANGGEGGGESSYGLVSALGVTARRLRMHTLDIANFEPLALLVLVPLFPFARRARSKAEGDARRGAPPDLGARAALALVGALVVAYAPFYFDGDYPGGGARFLADALPIEHALSALGIALLVARFAHAPTGSTRALVRASAFGLACSLFGFAVHAAYDHEQLRTRDGGHPMFDPEVLADRFIGTAPKDGAPARPALVFFDTDHGFALAHDPEATERAADALARHEKPSGVVMARLHNDDHDRLLFERLGRPPAWLYRFLPDSPDALAHPLAPHHETSAGEIQAWSPPPPGSGADSWRFEAENEWPPLAQTGSAWAEPIWVTDTCASPAGSGRALAIHARGADGGTVVLALPIPRAGAWRVTPRLLVGGETEGAAGLQLAVLGEDDAVLARWTPSETGGGGAGARKTCIDAPSRAITVASDHALRLSISIPAAESPPAARQQGAPARPDDAAHIPALAPIALDRILLTPSSR